MQTTIRKIGNSKGVIIPSAILNALQLEKNIEMEVKNNELIIRPIAPSLRHGWFDGYSASKDDVPLKNMTETETELEEWDW
ncbi:MAG: hypothetical protein L3J01_01190 [Thiomicrorhabdus sp.]|nr:hypothetical protein [Thiomicrorhabdus sp.]